ncbi:MAG: alanine racemase [Clostridiales Family XIII bacterium]|nr:alanine racemase [Clostridiales Family XIII bacterium]
MGANVYPRLVIDTGKLKVNAERVIALCAEAGISVAGVVKVAAGDPKLARVVADAGAAQIASSRLRQLVRIREAGVETPLMLIRIPMLSEAAAVVRAAEYSLNSDIEVLRALNAAAGAAGVVHNVILMIEIGDLREGVWLEEEYIAIAREVEHELKNLSLAGTGTNVSCYGSIVPTPEKLAEFITATERVENAVGREMGIISGSASTAFARVIEGTMPKRVNHIRLGEAIFINRDNEDLHGLTVPGTYRDVMTLEAEVVEVRVKPSHPIGEIAYDAFRFQPTYEDRGNRRRAIIAVGKVDYAFSELLTPLEPGVTVLGASSDHTLLDVEDAAHEVRVGDIMKFELDYGAEVFLNSSEDIVKVYR